MPLPNRVTIYGTGLIGGSFALALRRAVPGIHIAGIDKPAVVNRALQLKIIDSTEPQSTDLIVLATPIGDILHLLDEISPGNALITDVGSTKTTICAHAERRSLPFIGGHPMAGAEFSGPEAAEAGLFEDAPFFLCPVRSTPTDAVDHMQAIIKAIGAIPQVISPMDHDRLVARISHLPQIISTALANQTISDRDLAGPGLRSMTRMAASPLHIWRDIFKTSGFLPHELKSFIQSLQSILDSIERGSFDELDELFTSGGSE
jgi:prephenate dehydrogenase